jgi:septum formation protein
MKKIILGSSSKYRQKILKEMGCAFKVMAPDIDEKAIRFSDPEKLTMALAKAKTKALVPKIKRAAILITSDQVVTCAGKILEKPENEAEFREFIRLYNEGHPAETVTAVVVTDTENGRQASGTDIAKIWTRVIPEEIVAKLIKEGEIYYCSGGIDTDDILMRPFIEKIEGEIESIIGLPRKLTEKLLEEIRG